MLDRLRSVTEQAIPLTKQGFYKRRIAKKKVVEKTTNDKGETTEQVVEKPVIYHAVGPVHGKQKLIQPSVLGSGADLEYDADVIDAWTPRFEQTVVDEDTGKPLMAKEADKRAADPLWTPNYFVNPMQDLDYIVIEAITKNTIVGPLLNTFTNFLIGTGFRPELEIINPDGKDEDEDKESEALKGAADDDDDDEKEEGNNNPQAPTQPQQPQSPQGMPPGMPGQEPPKPKKKSEKEARDEKNAKFLKDHQYVIDDLREIDRQLDVCEPGEQDITFFTKMAACIDAANTFNRSALMFTYEKPVKIRGKSYRQIPSGLKYAHPRDLGINEVEPNTWRLRSVQWRPAYYQVPSTDMIYLWNPVISAKYHGAWWYGGSLVLPMLDSSRTLRKIIAVDFQAMAEGAWAGMPVITVAPKGSTAAEREVEYQSIASRFVRGGPNIFMEEKDDVSFNQVNLDPKVQEFRDLVEFLIKYNIACLGLPHSMFFDESSANRATLIGKIQLAIATVINPIREQFGQQICAQWYDRWFRLLYGDDKELMKKVRVKVVWDDLHIEDWFDKIESVNAVDARKQLTDEAYGEMAGIENYSSKVDPDAQVNPGGGSGGAGGKMDMGHDSQGNKLQMTRKKSPGDKLGGGMTGGAG